LTRKLPKKLPTQNKQRHSEFRNGRDLFPAFFVGTPSSPITAKPTRHFAGMENGPPKADKLFDQLKSHGPPKADKLFDQQR
jgi:hypothetical protein